MARFDVHRNKSSSPIVPYLLDVQADLLSNLRTRVVVPLVPLTQFGTPMTRLNPIFVVAGVETVMATTDIAGVDASVLGDVVLSLEHERYVIVQALDFLFQGF